MDEIDIEMLIKENAKRHGISDSEIDMLLSQLEEAANKIGIEADSLYMQLLDSISGPKPMNRIQILHQIRVMLHNNNVKGIEG